jgi:hypothetical protein
MGGHVSAARLLAVGFIFCCTAVAWSILGTSLVQRTGESDERLAHEVARLWGGHHDQQAPRAWVQRPKEVVENVHDKDALGKIITRTVTKTVTVQTAVPLDSSRVTVGLQLNQRRKGLLWYDTYAVAFAGRYRLHNPDDVTRVVVVELPFPSLEAIYDGFRFTVNGQEAPPVSDLGHGASLPAVLPPGGEAAIAVTYRSRGLGQWTYSFGPGIGQVRDFQLDMTTDFAAIDFPGGTMSPSSQTPQGAGWRLGWRFDSLVTGQQIGMDPPKRLNPGPLTARITFFAPVSLLFFMTLMVILGVLRRRSLHPMNYFFLAAGFFSFHVLLAYLVDHIDVHAAFLAAALTSIFLVVTYLRLVAGTRFALFEAGLAQLVFLVLFSYAFFFEGYAGLTVTLGAVVTLFILMQMTGRVDWEEVFARKGASPTATR